MKVSRTWLQKYFENPLPEAAAIADALTFRSSEIEEIEQKGSDTVLDVKVLPDRASYGLSHRGIARELSAALPQPLKADPLRTALPEWSTTDELSVTIEDAQKCRRYLGALVKGVSVGPSPQWLKEALEAVGQRSINNVVDATNYVMLDIGQPLHAFDAAKLASAQGYPIAVRGAHAGEKITTLTGEEYALPEGLTLIADAGTDAGLGIAGVKGGSRAAVTATTTDLIVEAANFDGTSVRRASQALKLWTDASLRFQNRLSPELASRGMRDVLALIQSVAGGTLEGVVDVYPGKEEIVPVSVTLTKVNGMLGTAYEIDDVRQAFERHGFSYEEEGERFTVTPPFERRDIMIPEDLVEEIGRVLGYENIASKTLPPLPEPADQDRYRGIERIKDTLRLLGFTELSTQSFAETGDIMLANPLDQGRPALRTTLSGNMQDALTRAAAVAPSVVGPTPALKLFEIGTVFPDRGEHLSLVLGYKALSGKVRSALSEAIEMLAAEYKTHASIVSADVAEIDLSAIGLAALGTGYLPARITLGTFRPFSLYPFALRDVAVWTPAHADGTPVEQSEVEELILKEAGDYLARIDLFDRFEKEGRTSYAFRLVFQASDRTLSDADLDPAMERITAALNAQEGWQVR